MRSFRTPVLYSGLQTSFPAQRPGHWQSIAYRTCASPRLSREHRGYSPPSLSCFSQWSCSCPFLLFWLVSRYPLILGSAALFPCVSPPLGLLVSGRRVRWVFSWGCTVASCCSPGSAGRPALTEGCFHLSWLGGAEQAPYLLVGQCALGGEVC